MNNLWGLTMTEKRFLIFQLVSTLKPKKDSLKLLTMISSNINNPTKILQNHFSSFLLPCLTTITFILEPNTTSPNPHQISNRTNSLNSFNSAGHLWSFPAKTTLFIGWNSKIKVIWVHLFKVHSMKTINSSQMTPTLGTTWLKYWKRRYRPSEQRQLTSKSWKSS